MHDQVHAILAGLVFASMLMPGAGAAQGVDIPDALNPDKLTIHRVVAATGVQIYTCGTNTAGARVWVFKAPEAELFDAEKKNVGKHYAGPTWEGLDGGKVMGTVKTSMPAPAGNAIPWLLLDISKREGAGAFTQAQAIVRMATTGGTAPAAGCDEAQSGQDLRVPYTATYVFLK